ncbi:hypothetical protein GCM10010305_49930 [Streptomyces termitum]|uniref:Uncharacterized protein n=2 Tax=Streptomyces termitum TaxID=67368 RepID=A0A918T6J6_9ACTN|nr:hypothetical protein GCM10010305_49930 [Streptomyces termitum]
MRHRRSGDTDEAETRLSRAVDDGGGTGESDPGGPDDADGKEKRKIDLSVPQVAGSALAAVIAAKLASTLGVYGTILGAGVISVVATCGGPLFQQLFRHTGEQMRDATTATRPRPRRTAPAAPAEDPGTLLLHALPGEAAGGSGTGKSGSGEFGTATTHGTRLRGWKRPVLAAAVVFGVTMGGITAYELASGQDLGGTEGTTTFGSVVRGGGAGQDAPAREEEPSAPAPGGSAGTPGDGDRTTGSTPSAGTGTPSTGATPGPGDRTQDGGATTAPAPDPTATGGTGPAPDPTGPTAPTTAPTVPAEPAGPSAPTAGAPARGDAPEAPAG